MAPVRILKSLYCLTDFFKMVVNFCVYWLLLFWLLFWWIAYFCPFNLYSWWPCTQKKTVSSEDVVPTPETLTHFSFPFEYFCLFIFAFKFLWYFLLKLLLPESLALGSVLVSHLSLLLTPLYMFSLLSEFCLASD